MTTKVITPTSLGLADAVQVLGNMTSPTGRVLSVYVDTSPGRVAGGAYLLAYRDGCRALRNTVAGGELDALDAAARQAESALAAAAASTHPGVALFASGSSDYLFSVSLPDPPLEDVMWGEVPVTGPLAAMLDQNARIAVVLFDSQRARVFSVFLGAIEFEAEIRDDVPAKQATGGWYSLAQTSMVRHREDHLRRHAEHTVRTIMDLLRQHGFEQLVLGGPEEAMAVLRRELPRPLRTRVAGQLHLAVSASEADVLQAARDAARALEHQADKQLVDELFADGPHAVIGPAATLPALAQGRVHLLVLADTFHTPGGRCVSCHRLVTYEHTCPGCGQPTTPLPSLREGVIQQAREQGALIQFVDGVADRRLEEYGGIGAWTRF